VPFKIAIFASGAGSNAKNIIHYFALRADVEVALVATNNAHAGVLDIAASAQIPTLVFNRAEFQNANQFAQLIASHGIDLVVLAGFLWRVPAPFVEAFEGRILNVHPSLLPKFGGKGMYGHFVHEAVKAAGETESGITVHWVNEHYDEGAIFFQAKCAISPSDSAEDIEQKVRALEIAHFPEAIDRAIAELKAKME
jgi:phosphoribosylglycinamide formyltransferase-1